MGLFDHLVDYGYFFFNHLMPYGLFALLSISGLEYVSHAFHERKRFLEMSIRLHYLQTFLEDAGLIVVRLNRTGHVAFVNPFFLQLTGYQEKEVLGKDWFETFVPKTTQYDVQGVFLQVVQHKFFRNYRNSILTSSGEEKLIEWFNVRLYDQANKITGTLSVGIDITDQDKRYKELEHDLAEARALADRLRTELQGL
jgi:PAS domain S-box-containing protein